MVNRAFATEIFEFIKKHDDSNRYEGYTDDETILEIEGHLSDLHMVRETVLDIENKSDSFLYHNQYIDEAVPLLRGLHEIERKLETEQRRRMVGDTAYEVKHAVHVGVKEIVFAEDRDAENGLCWFVGNYTSNDILSQYADCQVSDDYLEAMQEFTDRVTQQIEAVRNEREQINLPGAIFTAAQCYPNDYSQDITGKVVAIRADVFRSEYQRGDYQLIYVTGGHGAHANSRGSAVYCYHLNNSKHTRFERRDVLGEVRPEAMPDWVSERLAAVKEQIAAQKEKSNRERDDER